MYFICKYFRFECYREWNLWEGMAKEFAGYLGISRHWYQTGPETLALCVAVAQTFTGGASYMCHLLLRFLQWKVMLFQML